MDNQDTRTYDAEARNLIVWAFIEDFLESDNREYLHQALRILNYEDEGSELLSNVRSAITTLEGKNPPPASNTEALEALDRILMSYKLMLNDIELGTPKNEDGSKTLPPWLRDCRNDLKLSETIRKALTIPPAKKVDVEALIQKHITETGNTSGLMIFDWLVEKGIINADTPRK